MLSLKAKREKAEILVEYALALVLFIGIFALGGVLLYKRAIYRSDAVFKMIEQNPPCWGTIPPDVKPGLRGLGDKACL